MAELPVCSGAELVRVFERAGWTVMRQKGSHVTLTRVGSKFVLTVPLHRELGPGIVRSLIRKAGLTTEEFASYLKA